MWTLKIPVLELIFRAGLIYIFVFLLFRLIGKKQLGQLSPFDFILLLIISESVSNGLSGGDNSLLGALISCTTLLSITFGLDFLAFKSHRLENILDGKPQVLIENGQIQETVRTRAFITEHEIMSALRLHEIGDLKDVRFAILETNGKISVIKAADSAAKTI